MVVLSLISVPTLNVSGPNTPVKRDQQNVFLKKQYQLPVVYKKYTKHIANIKTLEWLY